MKRASLFGSVFFCMVVCFSCSAAFSEELDILNRPVNTSGLTGLLFTTAPYTLPRGTVEIGASILVENSVKPDYTLTEVPLSISAGVSEHSELAVRGSYFQIKQGSTTTSTISRRTGDVEVSYKWNFLPQAEESIKPGLALIVTGIVPADSSTDRMISSIQHWGMRLGLSTGTELTWKEHILGIYADAQVCGQDLTEKRLRDTYELLHAGLVLPISKYQNLQMLIEYTLLTGKSKETVVGGDYSGMTYGIRLVTERLNITVGTEFQHKKAENFDGSGRVIGIMSVKF